MTLPLETPRLRLRPWEERDRAPFAAMGQDPEVMRHFPALLTRAESDAAVDRLSARLAEDGMTFLAVERKADGAFLGFTGLVRVRWEAPFAPAVEIGWRLARFAWGQGHATEAARACLAWGFGPLGLAEIVAMAVPGNQPSHRVMERIGMARDPGGDFDHPLVPADWPHRRHWLWRISRR